MTGAGCGIGEINLPQHSIKWREKSGLAPPLERQNHTTSPSASCIIRLAQKKRLTLPRPSHPCPTFVTIAKRPSWWAGTVELQM